MGISTKVPPLMGLCSQVGTVCREPGAQCQGLRGGEPVAGTGMDAFVSPQTPLVPYCLQCFDYTTSFKPPGLSSYCFLPWNVLPFFCFMNAVFLPYSFFFPHRIYLFLSSYVVYLLYIVCPSILIEYKLCESRDPCLPH